MGIVKIREKYQVTIPEDVRDKIACDVGEYVKVEVKDNTIIIKPVVVEERFSPAEIASLEQALRKQRKGKKMTAAEYKRHLEGM